MRPPPSPGEDAPCRWLLSLTASAAKAAATAATTTPGATTPTCSFPAEDLNKFQTDSTYRRQFTRHLGGSNVGFAQEKGGYALDPRAR